VVKQSSILARLVIGLLMVLVTVVFTIAFVAMADISFVTSVHVDGLVTRSSSEPTSRPGTTFDSCGVSYRRAPETRSVRVEQSWPFEVHPGDRVSVWLFDGGDRAQIGGWRGFAFPAVMALVAAVVAFTTWQWWLDWSGTRRGRV
jgi:hypothetical protein